LILFTDTEMEMDEMEYRGRGYGRNYPGNGPFKDLPPWQRPSQVYGMGKGYVSGDPYACQRFPWLPRLWWTDPKMKAGDMTVPSTEQPKQIIEQQIAIAESHIAALRKRLVEIEPEEKKE